MLSSVDFVMPSGSGELFAIISQLAVTGAALLNIVVDIHMSGIRRFPSITEELSIPDTSVQSRWQNLQVAKAVSPSSTTFKGIQTPTYQYQYTSEISGLTSLISVVALSIITGALVLSTSIQAPPSVDTPSASHEASTSRPSQNEPPQRRDDMPFNNSNESDRTPPHSQGGEGSFWVAKKQGSPKPDRVAQGGSPPPPPPPPPPSAQDTEDGINKSDLDWISTLLLFPILTLLLRRLLGGFRIVSEEIPHSDKLETLFVNVLTDVSIVDKGSIPEETCPNLIPWNYSPHQIFNFLSPIGGPPPVTINQSTTPAMVAIESRSIWNFCVDLATFVMSCALSCCAFLLYFSLGFDEENDIYLGNRQQEAAMVDHDQVPNAVNESWQNVEKEDVDNVLPGENSMFLTITDNSDERQSLQLQVDNVGPRSASTSTTVASILSPPSRANLNPMAKTFVPKQFHSSDFIHTLQPVSTSVPSAIEHEESEVPDNLDNNPDTSISSDH